MDKRYDDDHLRQLRRAGRMDGYQTAYARNNPQAPVEVKPDPVPLGFRVRPCRVGDDDQCWEIVNERDLRMGQRIYDSAAEAEAAVAEFMARGRSSK